jgi:MscS family membrane protein
LVNRIHDGQETAIYLKEILDRFELHIEEIPGPEQVPAMNSTRWTFRELGISIDQVQSGSQKGEWLFSPSLVKRAGPLYEQVKDRDYVNGALGAGYTEPWIVQVVPAWAKQGKYLELELWQWLGLLLAILSGLIVRGIVGIFLHLLKLITSRTKSDWDDRIVAALTGPLGLIASCGFWLICVKVLLFSGLALAIFQIALQLIFYSSLIWMAYRFADLAGDYLSMLASHTESTLDDQIVKLVARTLKLFAVLTGVILAAQNMGFNVVSLLAGLSIGGLAVALAMQTTLTNFIGSIIIMVDRAFKVGDWIKIGDAEGNVEEVDFRCTRLRTFYDSIITIPNSEVMSSKIDNLGKRNHRRVLTSLKITPDTPPDLIERLVDGIKQIIASAAATRKDLYHVVLKDFGPDSLEIMIYFFVKAPDLSRELSERHRVLLEILRLAHGLNIRFAVPVKAIQMERSEGEA